METTLITQKKVLNISSLLVNQHTCDEYSIFYAENIIITTLSVAS